MQYLANITLVRQVVGSNARNVSSAGRLAHAQLEDEAVGEGEKQTGAYLTTGDGGLQP